MGVMDEQRLRDCIDQRMSTRQIAQELGCSQTNVRHHLRRLKLKTNPLPGKGRGGRGCEAHGQTKCPHCYKGGAYHVTKRRKKLKRMLVEERGGRCEAEGCPVDPGYEFEIGDLDFHHLNPDEKMRQLSNWSLGEEALRQEAAKCILTCPLCHRRLDRELRVPMV
jgi:hypothetical protein